MQYEASSPIWLQVMTDLQMKIMTGFYPPGSRLPGGRELALAYGINPNTAARVYQELEKTGLSETRRGMGTYVTGREERVAELRQRTAMEAARAFRDKMRQLGVSPEEAAEWIRGEE